MVDPSSVVICAPSMRTGCWLIGSSSGIDVGDGRGIVGGRRSRTRSVLAAPRERRRTGGVLSVAPRPARRCAGADPTAVARRARSPKDARRPSSDTVVVRMRGGTNRSSPHRGGVLGTTQRCVTGAGGTSHVLPSVAVRLGAYLLRGAWLTATSSARHRALT